MLPAPGPARKRAWRRCPRAAVTRAVPPDANRTGSAIAPPIRTASRSATSRRGHQRVRPPSRLLRPDRAVRPPRGDVRPGPARDRGCAPGPPAAEEREARVLAVPRPADGRAPVRMGPPPTIAPAKRASSAARTASRRSAAGPRRAAPTSARAEGEPGLTRAGARLALDAAIGTIVDRHFAIPGVLGRPGGGIAPISPGRDPRPARPHYGASPAASRTGP